MGENARPPAPPPSVRGGGREITRRLPWKKGKPFTPSFESITIMPIRPCWITFCPSTRKFPTPIGSSPGPGSGSGPRGRISDPSIYPRRLSNPPGHLCQERVCGKIQKAEGLGRDDPANRRLQRFLSGNLVPGFRHRLQEQKEALKEAMGLRKKGVLAVFPPVS